MSRLAVHITDEKAFVIKKEGGREYPEDIEFHMSFADHISQPLRELHEARRHFGDAKFVIGNDARRALRNHPDVRLSECFEGQTCPTDEQLADVLERVCDMRHLWIQRDDGEVSVERHCE